MKIAVQERFVAYLSRWRRMLLSLLGLGFVALGLWMVGAFGAVPTSSRYPYVETLITGWACLIFSSLCVLAYVPKIFEVGEQLRVDPSGVRYSQWSKTTIPWSQIVKVSESSYRSSRFIILHLKDPKLFPGKGLAALLAGPNRMMTGGDICISLSGMDRSYEEAITAIERYKPLG